ncbi:MAG: hypothetical protein MR743_05265 [Oscillospiraceae bacterium]|nr:hypothetical protein [Oscillospiraceae bacterium]MCI7639788.1 hypothetical protein [Clostridiales bacterium]
MKRFRHSRLLLTVCVLAVVLVGATLALQVSGVLALQNRISTAQNGTGIEEEGDQKRVFITLDAGSDPSYLRARVTVESTDQENAALPPDLKVLYTTNGTPGAAPKDTVLIQISNGWVDGGDGFYYYQGILSSERVQFVERVVVGEGVDLLTTQFDVVVYQESALALEDDWSQAGMATAFGRL